MPISFQPRRFRGIQYGQSITGYRPGQARVRPATYYTRNEDEGPDARQREMVARLSRLEQEVRVRDRNAAAKPRDSYGRTAEEREAVLREVFASAGYAAPAPRDIALAANMSNEDIVDSVLPPMDQADAPDMPPMDENAQPMMLPMDQTTQQMMPPMDQPAQQAMQTMDQTTQQAMQPAYTPPMYQEPPPPPPPAYVWQQPESVQTAAPATTLYADRYGNMVTQEQLFAGGTAAPVAGAPEQPMMPPPDYTYNPVITPGYSAPNTEENALPLDYTYDENGNPVDSGGGGMVSF